MTLWSDARNHRRGPRERAEGSVPRAVECRPPPRRSTVCRLAFIEWLAAIDFALLISPYTWSGETVSLHIHVWTAIILGGAIVSLPVALAWLRPGAALTRHTVASGQMLMSVLLIHLSGGRIETHFHIFGSLAFLALYRDWKVLVTASVIVAVDHFFRGVYWPRSVYGVLTVSPWRWAEHAAWVVFEDIVLILGCLQITPRAARARRSARRSSRQPTCR